MRRKVIQDFANVFCQHLIDLPNGYDLAEFAHHGSGVYTANILTGECSYNGNSIPQLRTCDEYKAWLQTQLVKHGVPEDKIAAVLLKIEVDVREMEVRFSYGHKFSSAHFFFDCRSQISTDEKSYVGRMKGNKVWGF